MDLATFRDLLRPRGQEALAEAVALAPTEATALACLTRLRRRYPPALAAAALDQALLRARAAARGKFARAERMYFTREGLEQATGETIARYRARRYAPFGVVADLACGLGGDALALAAEHPVLAVDRDPLRLALARENARAYGVAARLQPVLADLATLPPPRADSLFCDPARRTATGRRVFTTRDYRPPLGLVVGWRERVPALGVKISPGVDYAELPPADEGEVEFIAERGELKEAVLWFGPLRTAARRATLLPGGDTLATDGGPPPTVACAPPGRALYEPDPAVIRAHLVEDLAVRLGAAKLDPEIAYLTADAAVPTPFARAYAIEAALPFSLKRLAARLRDLDAGEVTVKKRGSPLDTDALARRLRGTGTRPWTVVLTQVLGRPYALICRGP
ncbi:MAG TPA: methyltransferase domain-containing protein [Thermomicrobiales bacterium]|nr:methyltransferase domain-containing protein [Thermomicrobiales bacterium]